MQYLSDFAYLPCFYDKLDYLATITLSEPWRYKSPEIERCNERTPILEKYLQRTFEELMRLRAYAAEPNAYVYIGEKEVVFNTGLLTPLYQDVYAYMAPNYYPQNGRNWALTSFFTESAAQLSCITKLPKPLNLIPNNTYYGFHPGWALRMNLDHMLLSEDHLNRLPASIRSLPSLAQTMEACGQQSMKRARYSPGIVVPQWYSGRLQYLLPLFITNSEYADLALTLDENCGFYTANTAITLQMAYGNARLIAHPETMWLREAVEGRCAE